MTDNIFDLQDKPEGVDTSPGIEDATIATQTQKVSPTALSLDKWGMRRGEELLQESERLQSWKLESTEVADLHGAAFEPEPQLAESCQDERRHEFFKTLLETPEYHSLHTQTVLDEAASEIAAHSFAEQWSSLKKTKEPKDQIQKDIQNLKHIAKALKNAEEEVENFNAMANGLGGDGSKTANRVEAKRLAELYRKVRNNATLHRICELAGRYRRAARAKQRQKAVHGQDDMVGVVLDDSIGRLLPQELAKLALPEFEDDVMRRLVEKQTMCRQWRGVEPVAKGPIIITVDESGSMTGEKHCLAKALALTMAWVAKHQKRWCGLVGFSGGTEGTRVALPPGKWDEAALLEWLEHFYGGGTDMDVPLEVLPNKYWEELKAPKGKTDLIVITDGICAVSEPMKKKFLAWKHESKVRMITLAIGCNAEALRGVSDEIHNVSDRLGLDEAGIDRVLAI